MSHRLIIRPLAETDIAAAKRWYSQKRAGLGDDFVQCVEEALDRIREFPEIHAFGYREVRQTLVRRFPYVVYYRLVDDVVTVLAVLHGSRHPRTWQQRS